MSNLMLRVHGDPQVRRRTHDEAAETGLRDPRYREGQAVDHERGADDRSVAAESPFPQPVADHRGEWLALPLIVGGREHAASAGSNTDDVEPVPTHELRGYELRRSINRCLHGDRRCRDCELR